MTGTTQHILVITLSNIGDAIMTTPVLEALHRRYPEAIIDLVADPRSASVFTHCPYRGRILLRDKVTGKRGTLRLIRAVRQTRYDLIVDLRTDGYAYLLRARQRLCKWHSQPRGPHAVEQHMGVLNKLDITDIPPTRLWLTPALQATADALLQALPGPRWLALGPGANWEPKIWPSERFQALANTLQDRFDAVVLLGGPADVDRCAQVENGLKLPALNLAGSTDLLEAGAVLARSALFVGNDSGLGHIAAAVGTATLTLFGPGQPQRYHPWGEAAHWLVEAQQDLRQLSVETVALEIRRICNPGGME